jgi:ATPase subunit of ABC transporter with duplicated ATPase domains
MNKTDEMPKKNPLSFQLNLKDFEKATDEEKAQQVRMSESITFFKDGMRRLKKNKIAMTCLAILILIALIVTFVPMIYPYTYEQQLGVAQGKRIDKTYNNLKPFEYGETELERIANGEKIFPHIFGTDAAGRDYEGEINFGHQVHTGYFDQEQTNLKGENTVIDEIWDEVPDLNYYEIRRILAQFLFYGDDMYKLVEDLSGGERGRLSLLKLMTSNANFLLMDEPTNHLDIDSKEVLEDSLINYEGTVLVVSHDRYFLNKVVNKIYDLSEEGTFEYLGNYDYYLEKKAELEEPNDKETTSKTKTQINAEKKKEREQIRDRQQREKAIRDLEEKIFMHENEIHELETKLCQPSTYTDNFLIISLNEKLNIRKKELQDLYTLWEEFIDN